MNLRNWAGLLIILQFLDGLLTYIGVKTLGVAAEGNPLIRYLIETFGPEVGLLSVKFFAILVIVYLTKVHHITFLKTMFKVLVFIYFNVVGLWIYAFYIWSIWPF